MRGVIYGPAHDLQVFFSRGGHHRGIYQVAPDGQLARADLQGLIKGLLNVAVAEQGGHQRRFNFSDIGQNRGVEGDNDGSRDFARLSQGADQRMFAAPRAPGLHLQVKDYVVFFGKIEDFLEGGDALAGVLADEPGTGVQTAQIGKGHFVNRAFSIGGAVHRFIVNGHQARVARQLQIGFDKGGA